jgi:hypothetical protein
MTPHLELDFYSRPILDENEKKLWELLICNADQTVQYAEFCKGSEANARWLASSLEKALDSFRQQDSTFVEPETIRFFRRPMSTIISRACETVGLNPQPSRRTFALNEWLQERHQSFYPQQAGYQPLMPVPAAFEPAPPQPLPQTLIGDGWSLVNLQKQDFDEIGNWSIIFQDQIPPALDRLAPETIIPGLVIYSKRALPLAAWMNGFELGSIAYLSTPKPQLILETGIAERWIVANVANTDLKREAQSFEQSKQTAENIHFIAIQESPDVEEFAGFWVLQELLLD